MGCPSVVGHFQWHLCHRQDGRHWNLFCGVLASKKVCLQPDIVEYSLGDQAPMYDCIIGKQTMHDLGVKLDFQEKTITIEEILLPMRNIANLQLKSRITTSLRENTCFAQEPISTRSATKHMVKILTLSLRKQIFQPLLGRIDLTEQPPIERSCSQCCSNLSRFLMAH